MIIPVYEINSITALDLEISFISIVHFQESCVLPNYTDACTPNLSRSRYHDPSCRLCKYKMS